MKKILLLALVAIGASGVWFYLNKRNHSKVVSESFYYWKNTLSKNELDSSLLNQLKIRKLYIKLFDVGWREGEGVVPVSTLVGDLAIIPSQIEIIPTVFITNEAFLKTSKEDVDALALKVFNRIKSYYIASDTPSVSGSFNSFSRIKEVQIDCDWSEKTREKYFQFLKTLKTELSQSVQLSATIRLHQVKYRSKTGIPPVEKGMLMMYNVLNPTDFNDRNSIFDEKEVTSYLKNQKTYPLHLDVALPLFSWGITYRHNKFFQLLNGMTRKDAEAANWLEKNKTLYMFRVDTLIQNHYFRMGDLLKIEDITPSVLSTCTDLARPIIGNDTLTISFFHFDSKLINEINSSTIQHVYESWR